MTAGYCLNCDAVLDDTPDIPVGMDEGEYWNILPVAERRKRGERAVRAWFCDEVDEAVSYDSLRPSDPCPGCGGKARCAWGYWGPYDDDLDPQAFFYALSAVKEVERTITGAPRR